MPADKNGPDCPMSRAERQGELQEHQQEFPVQRGEDRRFTRREFGKFSILVSGGMVCGQAWLAFRALTSDAGPATGPREPIGPIADVPVGTAIPFRYPKADGEPAILVRLSADRIAAYIQRCTHLSCAVVWDPESTKIRCPCHEGIFDPANGRPTAGPPKRPLTAVRVEVQNGTIYAIGVEETA